MSKRAPLLQNAEQIHVLYFNTFIAILPTFHVNCYLCREKNMNPLIMNNITSNVLRGFKCASSKAWGYCGILTKYDPYFPVSTPQEMSKVDSRDLFEQASVVMHPTERNVQWTRLQKGIPSLKTGAAAFQPTW